jgi:hypothetical protein
LPIYEPKRAKPHPLELFDNAKAKRLEKRIMASSASEEEKRFLIAAAQRHVVFNYEKIADYYSHSPKEIQELFEQSALVVIDFNKAFELGYVQLAYDIANQYLGHYED